MKNKQTGKGAHWPIVELGEAVTIESQGVIPQRGTVYRYVGLEDIEQQTGRILAAPSTDGGEIQSLKYLFGSTHMLYGKLRPNLNKVALPDFSGIWSTDILPLLPKTNAFKDYVAYYLRSPGFVSYATQNATGTKMPRFGPQQFLKAPIPLPALPVQERIAQILQRADEIRRKRKEAVELAGNILSAAFINMFGDPRKNLKGFDLLQLSTLSEIRSGVTKGKRFGERETVEVPYLRVANVQDGFLDLSEVKTIKVPPEEVERYHLENGDILMTEGGDPDKLGRGCIWRNQIEGCIHQNHVFRVRTDKNRLAPEYLAALLRTQYAKLYFLSCAKRTSNLASVNKSQVGAFQVPTPPIELQSKFVSAVEQWQQAEGRLVGASKDASLVSIGLMHQAFAGELTAEWEAANAEQITQQQAFHERLPRLLVLALLTEKIKRASRAAEVLVTALMKYVFLLQMEGNGQRLYHFVPYHYGPFAKELYTDLNKLEQEGLVRVENDSEEDKTRITLTDLSKAAQALADLPDDARQDAASIVQTYGDLDHNTLLKTVYERFPAYAKRSRLNRARRSVPSGKKGS
jgi:type I restriction enzyme S subunit